MEYLLKFFFKFHREKLIEMVVTDFFGSIPPKVSEQAIYILEEKRRSVEQWFAFQSFVIQRRMVQDPKNGQVLYGMLLQIKMMQHMISAGKPFAEDKEGSKSISDVIEERKRSEKEAADLLEKGLQGAEAFKKGSKK